MLNVEFIGKKQEIKLYRQDYSRTYWTYTNQFPLEVLVSKQFFQIFNRGVRVI